MTSKTLNKFSLEVSASAVRMVRDHEAEHTSRWQALLSISAKIGCTGQTLNEWLKQAERDSGRKPGLTTDMAARLKGLERENRELRQANEILRKASAHFVQAELDCRFKPRSPSSTIIVRHTRPRVDVDGAGGRGRFLCRCGAAQLVLQQRGGLGESPGTGQAGGFGNVQGAMEGHDMLSKFVNVRPRPQGCGRYAVGPFSRRQGIGVAVRPCGRPRQPSPRRWRAARPTRKWKQCWRVPTPA